MVPDLPILNFPVHHHWPQKNSSCSFCNWPVQSSDSSIKDLIYAMSLGERKRSRWPSVRSGQQPDSISNCDLSSQFTLVPAWQSLFEKKSFSLSHKSTGKTFPTFRFSIFSFPLNLIRLSESKQNLKSPFWRSPILYINTIFQLKLPLKSVEFEPNSQIFHWCHHINHKHSSKKSGIWL